MFLNADGVISFSGFLSIRINLVSHQLHIGVVKKETIYLVANNREMLKKGGFDALEIDIFFDSQGKPKIKYFSVEAFDELSERIYAQPIMFS